MTGSPLERTQADRSAAPPEAPFADTAAKPVVTKVPVQDVTAKDIVDDLARVETPIPETGERIGHYRLGRVIGRGGMGVVHDAWDEHLKRRVAVKVLASSAGGRTALERFKQEATLAARLRHPNVVVVHEAGTLDGRAFIAMEFVEGETLEDWINRHLGLVDDLPPERRDASRIATATSQVRAEELRLVSRWIRDVARALHYGHAYQAPGETEPTPIIHRDVKPANVIVDRGGTPKLLDYGLAKEVGLTLTLTREAVGTPLYMSPEQLFSSRRVGPRSDVYSLGMTLYACITLARPFELSEPGKLFEHLMHDDPPTPRRLNPNVPVDLETIVRKATEKDERLRYESAQAMAEDLDAFLDGRPIRARRVGPLERGRRFLARHPAVAALALVVALGSGAALAKDASDERARVERERMKSVQGEEAAKRAFSDAGEQFATASMVYDLAARSKEEEPEGERWLDLLNEGQRLEQSARGRLQEAREALRQGGLPATIPPALRRRELVAAASRGARDAQTGLARLLDECVAAKRRLLELDELSAWAGALSDGELVRGLGRWYRNDWAVLADEHWRALGGELGAAVAPAALNPDVDPATLRQHVTVRLAASRARTAALAVEEEPIRDSLRAWKSVARVRAVAPPSVGLRADATVEACALVNGAPGPVLAHGAPGQVLEVPPGDLALIVREPGATAPVVIAVTGLRAGWGARTNPVRVEVPIAPGAVPAGMVHVPASEDEPGFFLDANEVSGAEYAAFVAAVTQSGHATCPEPERRAFPAGKDHRPRGPLASDRPVTGVDWWDARAFAAWSRKRLVRRSEWLRAALPGSAREPQGASNLRGLADGWLWTSPASAGPVALSGARNLFGNVAEWLACEDEAYPWREAAGGGWSDEPAADGRRQIARYEPLARGDDLGFRCARDVPRPVEPSPAPPAPTIASGRDGATATLVRGGTFTLGGWPYRLTHANVYVAELPSFYVDDRPVSWRAFAAFAQNGGVALDADGAKALAKDPDAPAVVTWDDASAYAAWAGKRLPSEAEYDAFVKARAGTASIRVDDRLLEWCADAFHPDFQKWANGHAPVNRWTYERGHVVRLPTQRTGRADGKGTFRCVLELEERTP